MKGRYGTMNFNMAKANKNEARNDTTPNGLQVILLPPVEGFSRMVAWWTKEKSWVAPDYCVK